MFKFFNTLSKNKIIATLLFICMLSFCMVASCFTLGVFNVKANGENFTKISHYEFNDRDNLGKDTLNNYDLVAQNVFVDAINGGVALKDGGVFYAPAINSENQDFSDLITGSYSLSMRVFMRSINDGFNYLLSTGAYGNTFQVAWSYEGLAVYLGNEQTFEFGTSATALGGKPMFDTTFSWYRITMIYDQTANTFRVVASKEVDEEYSFDATANLTQNAIFGGIIERTFTIGAQSNFGDWIDGEVNTSVSNGVNEFTLAPSISDLRVYSGVIDNDEISSINAYDTQNLLNKSNGYNKVVHYEFKYPHNLGKDSLGNFDLVATEGVQIDSVNGGVTLGGEDGVLYAPAIDENGSDFSDLITGSYSLSMRAYLRYVDDGANNLISTGSYGSSFQTAWSYEGLSISLGNGVSGEFGTSGSALGDMAMFSDTFAWYRITMIYDEVNMTFKVLATKQGDSGYSYEYSLPLTQKITFGKDENGYGFTIGAQSKIGESIAQHSSAVLGEDTAYANISDFRLYTGVIDTNEINSIKAYDQENYLKNDYSNATEKQVKPLVWYEFNDTANIGKDSMGNFDLCMGGNQQFDVDDGFVTFTRENRSYLYAPAISGSTDFSDLISGSYTISYTVKADNSITEGDRYAITTSNYASAFQVIGFQNGYEVVYSSGGHKEHAVFYPTGGFSDKWVNITITFDKETSTLAFYVDGELFNERKVDNYVGFTSGNNYTFTIGGQATVDGIDGAQFFDGSIADVKVYDFALSKVNVKDMYLKSTTNNPFTSLVNYGVVDQVEVDTTVLNTVISNTNSLSDILSNLPTEVAVKSGNETKTCSVVWLGYENGVITGYVKNSPYANTESLFARINLSYRVDFDSITNGQFVEVKIDGEDYVNQTIAVGETAQITFKIQPSTGYKVASVSFNNQRIEPDTDGVYTVTVSDFSKISAFISAIEYKITYVLNNGEENEEQIYGYGETVILASYFTKEGFDFEGWYATEDLSGEQVTTIDSLTPQDITLYAKWTEKPVQSGGNQGDTGCKGNVNYSALSVIVSVVGLTYLIIRKKGGKNNG